MDKFDALYCCPNSNYPTKSIRRMGTPELNKDLIRRHMPATTCQTLRIFPIWIPNKAKIAKLVPFFSSIERMENIHGEVESTSALKLTKEGCFLSRCKLKHGRSFEFWTIRPVSLKMQEKATFSEPKGLNRPCSESDNASIETDMLRCYGRK